jgi:hypothetical protein
MEEPGPRKPATIGEMMAGADPSVLEEAYATCAECRARHGGWCIDELTPQHHSMCPLERLLSASPSRQSAGE